MRSAIFGPSHHRHTLVLDLAFSTNAPVGQTVPRLAVWTVGAVGGDALSFGSAFGEPVTVSHEVHTWPLGWTVGFIGGDALRASERLHQWLQPSKEPNVAPFARLDSWGTGGWDPLQN